MNWRKKLLEKYNVEGISCGVYYEGFTDGLKLADREVIMLTKNLEELRRKE